MCPHICMCAVYCVLCQCAALAVPSCTLHHACIGSGIHDVQAWWHRSPMHLRHGCSQAINACSVNGHYMLEHLIRVLRLTRPLYATFPCYKVHSHLSQCLNRGNEACKHALRAMHRGMICSLNDRVLFACYICVVYAVQHWTPRVRMCKLMIGMVP